MRNKDKRIQQRLEKPRADNKPVSLPRYTEAQLTQGFAAQWPGAAAYDTDNKGAVFSDGGSWQPLGAFRVPLLDVRVDKSAKLLTYDNVFYVEMGQIVKGTSVSRSVDFSNSGSAHTLPEEIGDLSSTQSRLQGVDLRRLHGRLSVPPSNPIMAWSLPLDGSGWFNNDNTGSSADWGLTSDPNITGAARFYSAQFTLNTSFLSLGAFTLSATVTAYNGDVDGSGGAASYQIRVVGVVV